MMSVLCAADNGLSFNELKVACKLTDGNLNRHLKVLREADAIRIQKAFVGAKPRTTVQLSRTGLERFNEYLRALEQVLRNARDSLPAERKAKDSPLGAAKAVHAG
jgi:DNA-binding transcriptional ArsR family regulator